MASLLVGFAAQGSKGSIQVGVDVLCDKLFSPDCQWFIQSSVGVPHILFDYVVTNGVPAKRDGYQLVIDTVR